MVLTAELWRVKEVCESFPHPFLSTRCLITKTLTFNFKKSTHNLTIVNLCSFYSLNDIIKHLLVTFHYLFGRDFQLIQTSNVDTNIDIKF